MHVPLAFVIQLVIAVPQAKPDKVTTIEAVQSKEDLCNAMHRAKLHEAIKKTALETTNITYANIPDRLDQDCFFFVGQKATYSTAAKICSGSGNGAIALVTGRIISCLNEMFHLHSQDFFIRTTHTDPESLLKEYNNSLRCDSNHRSPVTQPTSSSTNQPMLLQVSPGTVPVLGKVSQIEKRQEFFLCELDNSGPVQSQRRVNSRFAVAAPLLHVVKGESTRKATSVTNQEKTGNGKKKEVSSKPDKSDKGPYTDNTILYFILGGLTALVLVLIIWGFVVRRHINRLLAESEMSEERTQDTSRSRSSRKPAPPQPLATTGAKAPLEIKTTQLADSGKPDTPEEADTSSRSSESQKFEDQSEMFHTVRGSNEKRNKPKEDATLKPTLWFKSPLAYGSKKEKEVVMDDDTLRGLPPVPANLVIPVKDDHSVYKTVNTTSDLNFESIYKEPNMGDTSDSSS